MSDFADVDAFSMEYFEDEIDVHPKIDFVIVVPPLKYEGKWVKGIFFSQAVDYLYKLFPQLSKLFHSIGNAQWGAIPWSRQADGLFSLYEHPKREIWFKQAYPDRADKALVPLQDADFTNEYRMSPVPPPQFTQDVICVSRLHDLKNIPLIAEALKIHREKYFPIRLTLVLGKEMGSEYAGADDR